MGKSTISMAIFNSYVKLPEGTTYGCQKSPCLVSSDPYLPESMLIYWSVWGMDEHLGYNN